MKRALSALVIPASLFITSVAAGQPAKADALFREGREAMKRNDYRVACAKFEESQKADPADGTLVNLAVCEDKAGRAADAYTHVKLALKQLPTSDPMFAIAKGLADRLQPKLIIDVPKDVASLDGLEVKPDGRPLARASWGKPLDVEPGDHVLIVTAPGYRTWEKSVTVTVGKSPVAVLLPMLERGTSGGREAGSGKRTLGTILIVGGAAVGGLGYLSWKSSQSHEDDARKAGCGDTTCPTQAGIDDTNQARSDGKKAALLGAVGVSSVIVGVALYLSAPEAAPKAKSARAWVSPSVDRGHSSLTIGGVW